MSNLMEFCRDLPTREIELGSVFLAEGTTATPMFVLVAGTVRVERDGVRVAVIDTPGAVFGEMSVVLNKPATATLRAETPLELVVVDDPIAFLTDHPGAALEVLRTTASRLDGLTQYLVDVKQQLDGAEGHLGMVGQILETLVNHQPAPHRTGSARDPEGTACDEAAH